MSGKTILVLDQDETVANIIKKSILGYDPTSTVTIESSPINLAEKLKGHTFDCLIVDSIFAAEVKEIYLKAGINKNVTPPTMIITAYGDSFHELSASTRGDTVMVQKPIDMRKFSELLAKVIEPLKTEISQQASLSSSQYAFCQEKLFELRSSAGARCIILSDSVGHILVSVGNASGLSSELITSLLGGGVATLHEAGNTLNDESVINLSYREGKKLDLYAINIGRNLLLVIVIDKTSAISRLGTVWYYARQSALLLQNYLAQPNTEVKTEGIGEINAQTVSDDLDKLFNL